MINNPRVFLWILLAVALWVNYEAWMRDYGAKPTPVSASAQSAAGSKATNGAPTGLDAAIPQVPASGAVGASAPAAAGAAVTPAASTDASNSAGTVHVKTDVLDLDISLQGGTIQRADLLKYPKVKGGSEPVRLMNRDSEQTLYLLQSGLTGQGTAAHPTHLATYTSSQQDYTLGANSTELRVPLTWTDDNGITVTKTYVFRPGMYRIDVEYDVANQSSAPWQAAPYAQILRQDPPSEHSMFNPATYAFRGPATYDGTRYRKLDIEDKDDLTSTDTTNGWVAALEHHFVGAIVPPADTGYRFTLGAEGRKYLLSAAGPLRTIAPGASDKFGQTFFIGPKLQSQLEGTGPELKRVADYGKLTILAAPLFWLLEKVHDFFGNWGVAIVVVTIILKGAFYPLSEASGKSMAKMKNLSPRIKNLQETYKDDREKLGRAMMELYQREKINPVAGCLPMIIQIPVFLAFYWVLLESVEMRQAPFMGWINDLSSRDPFFVLPVIMAGAMFLQYKLNPAPPDPVQAKIFMIMPLAMSVMFAFFPAGLVLYWVTNTIVSIAQQWNINRRISKAPVRKT